MTHAQMAKNALASRGIFSNIVSVDPHLTKRGCSWGISFDSRDKQKAVNLLRQRGIEFGEALGG